MANSNDDFKMCPHCRKNISAANFLNHEIFCARNIAVCGLCQEPYLKNQKEEHLDEFHAKVKCECGESVEKMHLDAHKSETCRKRQASCFYCELSLDFDKLNEHINFCGSRTERCSKCDRYVQVKDQAKHESSGCAYPAPGPKAKAPSLPSLPKIYKPVSVAREALNQTYSLLPCEFCHSCFASDELIQHQNICELNSGRNSIDFARDQQHRIDFLKDVYDNDDNDDNGDDSIGIPLNFNDLMKKNLNLRKDNVVTEYSGWHPPNPKFTVFDEPDDPPADKVPCEFCHKLFEFEFIILHETGCEMNTSVLDNAGPHMAQVITEYEKAPSVGKIPSEVRKQNGTAAAKPPRGRSPSALHEIDSNSDQEGSFPIYRPDRRKPPIDEAKASGSRTSSKPASLPFAASRASQSSYVVSVSPVKLKTSVSSGDRLGAMPSVNGAGIHVRPEVKPAPRANRSNSKTRTSSIKALPRI